MSKTQSSVTKEFIGLIWIGDEPGKRLSIMASSPEEAMAAVERKYGTGHVVSLWNEDDAAKER